MLKMLNGKVLFSLVSVLASSTLLFGCESEQPEVVTPPVVQPEEDFVQPEEDFVQPVQDEPISEDDFYRLIEVAAYEAEELRPVADSYLQQIGDDFESQGFECDFSIGAEPMYNSDDMTSDMHMYAYITMDLTISHEDWEYGDEPTQAQLDALHSINYEEVIDRVAQESDYEYVVVTLWVMADGFGYMEDIYDGAKVYNNGSLIVETTYSDLSMEDFR